VKFLTSLLLLSVLGLSQTACNTLSTRRDLFSPTRASGPYTKEYADMRDREGLFGISHPPYYTPGEQEGIFGISRNPHPAELPDEEEGLFGISRNER
jgi:hypothetical protein